MRELAGEVLGVLVRRGADFATAEDAVQEALLAAVQAWPDEPPRDAKGWLVTVAWRTFIDLTRADTARRAREERAFAEPAPGPAENADDTLELYLRCAHPSLSQASAVAPCGRSAGSPPGRSPRPTWCPRRPWRSGSAGPSGLSAPSGSTYRVS